MKKTRSINFAVVVFVFLIMVITNFLTALLIIIVYHFKLLPLKLFTPLILPFAALLVSLILGTIISIIIGKRFLKPINELIKATRIIAKGDFRIRVKERKEKNAVGELIKSFNMMTEELGSIELLRQNFINNFSHEFKTPIVSVRGFAKQLKNGTLPEDQKYEYIDIIINESERLAKMSSNILLLTKLENQKIISDKNEFYIDEQIRRCILLLEKQWSKKNIELNIDMDEIKYYTNEEMLSHVWINLLSNAIKFTKENSTIIIKCNMESNNIIVSFTDQGNGIHQSIMEHIFDKFYQGDVSRKLEGNGLGLSLVKRIVELCQGEISVTSELGNGSTFRISLPMSPC